MMLSLVSTAYCVFLITLHINPSTAFSAVPSSTARAYLKNIDANQFRHPLDRDITSFLQEAPLSGLASDAIRKSLAVVEQGVRLDLLSSSVKVSKDQLPSLHESMLEACRVLDLDNPPELYVQSNPQANAFTLALRGKDTSPIVVVTSALLDRCTDEEVQAIIGHELGHLKCEHSLYLTLGGLASTPLRSLPLIGSQTESLLQRWRLAAEYSCDRAAMLVAQDVSVVAGAMLKLFAGTSRATNTQAFIDQSLEYERLLESANPLVRSSIRSQQRTHPLPVKRVAELQKWADSKEYKDILSKAVSVEEKKGTEGKEE
uniref:Peptidase M48 domain-containing protein n=1 Tax=Helicotheca tamesis TaxID=374047 RepID=A0A7S2MD64_9STRA|mmetsp:Transcript_14026/g.19177  ORF Transcript_14026/g.19177 Transcript_14026/m.19177 type:complete len:316 (+) Transcript_14026:138-1085(+)